MFARKPEDATATGAVQNRNVAGLAIPHVAVLVGQWTFPAPLGTNFRPKLSVFREPLALGSGRSGSGAGLESQEGELDRPGFVLGFLALPAFMASWGSTFSCW